MDPRLLIVAIYAPSENNSAWYRLQQRFIAETTSAAYEFEVLLNGVDASALPGARVISSSTTNHGHAAALAEVVDHFRRRPHRSYLILDSDCFPVTRGWHDVLDNQMQRFGKSMAAPVRTENLDLFPHPCAVFLRPEALAGEFLNFDRSVAVRNLLGQEVSDVGTGMQHVADWLPLLRTNVRNVHPVAAAIYHHLFYHHGAGSRDLAVRVLRRYAYFDHWYDSAGAQRHDLLAALLEDPERFIASLMGHDEPLVRDLLRPGTANPPEPTNSVEEGRWLHVEVAQRDQTVSWLHAEVARRDAALASLGASLEGTAAVSPVPANAPARPDLATSAAIYGTDKLEHGYLPHYAHHFEPLRESAANVLEIGIREGASLRMWRDFFTGAVIHGLDIQNCEALAEPRIRIHRGDQSHTGLLRAIAEQAAPLDIVIDDGSHVNRDVLASFAVLFPLLRVGGLYVIEDVHTSYWSKYGGEHRDLNTGRTSTSLLKNLLDGLNAHWIPGRALQPLDALVDGIHCYPKLVFVSRGVNAGVQRPYEVRMMRETLAGRPTDDELP